MEKLLHLKKGIILTIVALLTMGAINITQIKANEVIDPIAYEISGEKNKDQQTELVTIQTNEKEKNIEVTQIENPDGKINKGTSSQYEAKANGTLTFIVYYNEQVNQEGNVHVEEKSKEVTYEVKGLQEAKAKQIENKALTPKSVNQLLLPEDHKLTGSAIIGYSEWDQAQEEYPSFGLDYVREKNNIENSNMFFLLNGESVWTSMSSASGGVFIDTELPKGIKLKSAKATEVRYNYTTEIRSSTEIKAYLYAVPDNNVFSKDQKVTMQGEDEITITKSAALEIKEKSHLLDKPTGKRNLFDVAALRFSPKMVYDEARAQELQQKETGGRAWSAYTTEDTAKAVTVDNIEVSDADLAAIKKGKIGRYAVKFSAGVKGSDQYVEKTLYMNISENSQHTIRADHAFLTQTQAKALTKMEDINAYTNVTVLPKGDDDNPQAKITINDWDGLKNGYIGWRSSGMSTTESDGYHLVKYEYGEGADKRTIEVYITVVPDDATLGIDEPHKGNYMFFGFEKWISPKDARALTKKDELADINQTKVRYAMSMPPKGSITTNVSNADWSDITSGKPGSYTITYSYKDSLYRQKINVLEEGIDESSLYVLYAKHGAVHVDDMEKITKKEELAKYNGAYVINKRTGEKSIPTVALNLQIFNGIEMEFTPGPFELEMKKGKVGTYEVTYLYDQDKLHTRGKVNLVLYDGTESLDKTFVINAKDGLISQTQAKSLANESGLIGYNEAKVIYLDGSYTGNPRITIDPSDWMKIKSGTIGTYTVIYSYGAGVNLTSQEVKITVYDDDSVLSERGDYVLTAKSAIILENEAKALANKEALIPINGAVVIYANGDKKTPTVQTNDFASIKAGKIDDYRVTYSYDDGKEYYDYYGNVITNKASKTVDLKVVADGTVVSPNRDFAIVAEDVSLNTDEAKNLAAKEDVTSLANAKVIFADSSKAPQTPAITIPKWNDLKAGKEGTYEATFTYEGVDVSITITVSQNYIIRYLFDYDNNGRVDMIDYAVFQSYLNGGDTPSLEHKYMSDGNRDGRVDIMDLAEIRLYLSDTTLELVEIRIPIK